MAKKSTIYNIFNDFVEALKPIVDKKYIFLKDRPKIGKDDVPMKKFIIVDLPLGIDDLVIGHKKTCLVTSGVLYLFTQARSNDTLDPNATGDFADSVEELFPIKGQYIIACNPTVKLNGSDGQGFQVTVITFDLHSRWGVFKKEE